RMARPGRGRHLEHIAAQLIRSLFELSHEPCSLGPDRLCHGSSTPAPGRRCQTIPSTISAVRYRAVFFDVGETLLHVPEPAPTYREILAGCGCPMPLAKVEAMLKDVRQTVDARIP